MMSRWFHLELTMFVRILKSREYTATEREEGGQEFQEFWYIYRMQKGHKLIYILKY